MELNDKINDSYITITFNDDKFSVHIQNASGNNLRNAIMSLVQELATNSDMSKLTLLVYLVNQEIKNIT